MAARKNLSPGQKAARTKGKTGLALAGAKAALTRYRAALKGTRGDLRAEILARISAAEATVQARSA